MKFDSEYILIRSKTNISKAKTRNSEEKDGTLKFNHERERNKTCQKDKILKMKLQSAHSKAYRLISIEKS